MDETCSTHQGKSLLGRPRFGQEDNTAMAINITGYEGAEWIQLAHDTVSWRILAKTVINFRVTQNVEIS